MVREREALDRLLGPHQERRGASHLERGKLLRSEVERDRLQIGVCCDRDRLRDLPSRGQAAQRLGH
jgi:hypothetical protein